MQEAAAENSPEIDNRGNRTVAVKGAWVRARLPESATLHLQEQEGKGENR